VVDVLPKETVHEQELGFIDLQTQLYNFNGNQGYRAALPLLLVSPPLVRILLPIPNDRHITIHL